MNHVTRIVLAAVVFGLFFYAGKKHVRESVDSLNESNQSSLSSSRRVKQEQAYYNFLIPEPQTQRSLGEPIDSFATAFNETENDQELPQDFRAALLEISDIDSWRAKHLAEKWIANDYDAARACILRELKDGSQLQMDLIISLVTIDWKSIQQLSSPQQIRLSRARNLMSEIRSSGPFASSNSLDSASAQDFVKSFSDPQARALVQQQIFQDRSSDELRMHRDGLIKSQEKQDNGSDFLNDFQVESGGLMLDDDENSQQLAKFEVAIQKNQKIPLKAPNTSSWRSRVTYANQSMADWLSRQSRAIQRTWMADVAESWTQFEPDKALQWVQSLEDCREKDEALQRSIIFWANNDPSKAVSYIETMPSSPLRETVIEDAVAFYATYDYPAAVAWLNKLPPSEGVEAGKRRIGYSTR